MERVRGIGGLFLRATEPERLGHWYADHLGIEARTGELTPGLTLFTATPPDDDTTDAWSVLFEVDDLDAFVGQLRDAGVEVELSGGVARLRDPEDNIVRVRGPTVDRPWSSHPSSVHVLDGERARGRARSLRWLPFVLAVVIFVVFLRMTEERPARTPPPLDLGPTEVALDEMAPSVAESEHGRLLGIDTGDLFVLGTEGMARVDFAHDRITHTPLVPLHTTGPVSFLVGRDRALLRPRDSVPGYVVRDGRPATDVPWTLNRGGHVFPGPEPGQLWVESDSADPARAFALLTMDGRATGVMLPAPGLPPWPLASDGRGHILFGGTGGVYLSRPGGLERVTTGAVLAVGPTRFLTSECDERARCATVVTDRTTGFARVWRPRVPRLETVPQVGTVSPDGAFAAVVPPSTVAEPQPTLHLLNLVSGEDHRLDISVDPSSGPQQMVWSPDGAWLFVATEGTLVAVELRTRHVEQLDVGLIGVSRVAIRPPS